MLVMKRNKNNAATAEYGATSCQVVSELIAGLLGTAAGLVTTQAARARSP